MPMIRPVELRELAGNTDRVTLGEQIKQARERLQMTQPELAELVGVNESTVSNWERDIRRPKNRLARLRQVLQMDAELVLTETDQHLDIDALTDRQVEQVVRSASDRTLWAEATRRFFERRESKPDLPKRGQHAPLPEHLRDPQYGERRQNGL